MKSTRKLFPLIPLLLLTLGCGAKESNSSPQVPATAARPPAPKTNSEAITSLAGIDTREGATLEGVSSTVWAVSISPDGKTLASGAYQKVLLWDLPTGKLIGTLTGHGDRVTALVFSPDSKMLASSGGEDQMIKFWDVAKQSEKGSLNEIGLNAVLSFTPDGKVLCGGGSRRWDAETRKPQPPIFDRYIHHAYSVQGDVAGASDVRPGEIFADVVEIASGKKLASFPKFGGRLIAVSSTGKCVLCVGKGTDQLSLWDFTGKKRVDLDGKLSPLFDAVAFSPDGKYLVGSMVDKEFKGVLTIWDTITGKPVTTLRGEHDFHSVAFSSDGGRLASGDDRGKIKVWEMKVILPR